MGFLEPGKSTWHQRGPANRRKPKIIPSRFLKSSPKINKPRTTKPPKSIDKVPEVAIDNIQPLAMAKLTSFLEDLPPEILQRIFIRTGLDSNLVFLNKHLYNQLKFNLDPSTFFKDSEGHIHWEGSEIVLQVIQENFQYDLNKGVNLRKIRKKLRSLLEKLPMLHSNDQISSFQEYLDRIDFLDYKAVSLDVLNYRFMSSKLAELLISRGFRLMNANQIEIELKSRKKYTELKLKEIERLIRDYDPTTEVETEETSSNSLDLTSEITPSDNKLDSEIIMLRELVQNYKPEGNDIYFPDSFMENSDSEDKLQMSQYLKKVENVMFFNNTAILNNLMTKCPSLFLKYYKFIVKATSDEQMDSGTRKISIYTIVTLFDTVNDLINASSNDPNDFNDNDHRIDSWPIGIDWYKAIKFFLKTFYSHNPDIDDHLIWEGLRNTNGEIIDLITEFSNPPASFI